MDNVENKYKQLFENMTTAFALHEMIFDDNGKPIDYRFLEINSSFEDMTGLQKKNVIGKTVLQVMPNTEKSWIDMYAKVVYTGHPTSFQNYSKELDRFFEGWAYRPQEGQFAVVFSDISEFKIIEKKLADYRDNLEKLAEERAVKLVESEQRFHMLFNHTTEPILIIDLEGNIIEFNNAAEKSLVFSEEQLRDINFFNLFTEGVGEGEENKKEILFPLNIDRGSKSTETVLKKGDNETFPVRLTANRIQTGSDHYIAIIISDITEQKIMEKTLVAAKEQAEKASQAKSFFLANVSHEIRTPINAILGMVYLMQDTQLTEQQREYMKNISSAARTLFGTINGILDFSKIESGKMQIETQSFNLKNLIRDIIPAFSLAADEKGLEFRTNIDEDIPEYVIGDAFRLSQILSNLLTNAIKFTEKGYIEISVSRMVQLRDIAHLEFAVKDCGIGLSKEELDVIFKPFEQADESVTRKPGGTGLGLAISRELTVLMGGKIVTASTKGVGSTFTVKLPLHISKNRDDSFSPSLDVSILKNAKILLAEDHEITRNVLSEIIRKTGAIVTIAKNGIEAVELVEKNDFDIILMDIQMPEMDGLTAAEKIRHLNKPGVKDVIILAVTAHAMIDDIRKSWAAGMNGHITKPIKAEALNRQLCAWISSRKKGIPENGSTKSEG
ncbi:MAG: response regulator [Spirochaetia bacterium]|nr:response regulator [Spirochaetia bacterium]